MNRSALCTTINSKLLQEFKKKCKANGENMNVILEALIEGYLTDEIEVTCKTICKLIPATKQFNRKGDSK